MGRGERFSEEIDERFSKAVEAVHLNRELYDEHFRRIHEEHTQKVRTVGSHIFEVLEEDFQPIVEHALSIPKVDYAQLALSVDERRIEVRREQLDDVLEELASTSLDHLVEAADRVDGTLGDGYAVFGDALSTFEDGDRILVAVAVMFDGEGSIVDVGSYGKVVQAEGRTELVPDIETNAIRTAMQKHENQLRKYLHAMSEAELAKMKELIARLPEMGLLDESLVPAYCTLLDRSGLNVLSVTPSAR